MTVASLAATLALIGFAAASCDEKKDVSQKSSEASIVTNDNGSVARTYTESTVTTNGNMVTERRRETRTTLDADGNMLESSTSEYAQSYPVGEEGMSGFAKTKLLAPGESETVRIPIAIRDLAYFDELDHRFVTDAGRYELLVGTSSRDIRGRETVAVDGETRF